MSDQDIATLGFSIDSTQAVSASQNLDQLTAAATRTEAAQRRQADASTQMQRQLAAYTETQATSNKQMQQWLQIMATTDQATGKTNRTIADTAKELNLVDQRIRENLTVWERFKGVASTVFTAPIQAVEALGTKLATLATGNYFEMVTEDARAAAKAIDDIARVSGQSAAVLKTYMETTRGFGIDDASRFRAAEKLQDILKGTASNADALQDKISKLGISLKEIGKEGNAEALEHLLDKLNKSPNRTSANSMFESLGLQGSGEALKMLDHVTQAIQRVGPNSEASRRQIEALGVSLKGLTATDAPRVIGELQQKLNTMADGPNKTALAFAALGLTGVAALRGLREQIVELDAAEVQHNRVVMEIQKRYEASLVRRHELADRPDTGMWATLKRDMDAALTTTQEFSDKQAYYAAETGNAWTEFTHTNEREWSHWGEMISRVASATTSLVGNTLVGAWNTVIEVFRSVGHQAISLAVLLRDLPGDVLGFLGSALSGIHYVVTKPLDKIQDGFTAVFRWIADGAVSMWDSIGAPGPSILDRLQATWDSAAAGFQHFMDNIGTYSQQGWDRFVDIWKNPTKYFDKVVDAIKISVAPPPTTEGDSRPNAPVPEAEIRAAQKLLATLDPLLAAQQRYREMLDALEAAHERGALKQEEYTRGVALAAENYRKIQTQTADALAPALGAEERHEQVLRKLRDALEAGAISYEHYSAAVQKSWRATQDAINPVAALIRESERSQQLAAITDPVERRRAELRDSATKAKQQSYGPLAALTPDETAGIDRVGANEARIKGDQKVAELQAQNQAYRGQESALASLNERTRAYAQIEIQISSLREAGIRDETTLAQIRGELRTKAERDFAVAARQSIEAMEQQAAAQVRLNAVIGQGEAAHREAAIQNRLEAERAKGTTNLHQLETQLRKDELEGRRALAAEFDTSTERELRNTAKLQAARVQGAAAEREAQLAIRAADQARREAVEASPAYEAALARITAALKRVEEQTSKGIGQTFDTGVTRQIADSQRILAARQEGIAAEREAEIAIKAAQQARLEATEGTPKYEAALARIIGQLRELKKAELALQPAEAIRERADVRTYGPLRAAGADVPRLQAAGAGGSQVVQEAAQLARLYQRLEAVNEALGATIKLRDNPAFHEFRSALQAEADGYTRLIELEKQYAEGTSARAKTITEANDAVSASIRRMKTEEANAYDASISQKRVEMMEKWREGQGALRDAVIDGNNDILRSYALLNRNTGTFFDGMATAAAGAVQSMETDFERGAKTMADAVNGVADTITESLFSGSWKTLRDGFNNLAKDLAKGFVRDTFKDLATTGISKIFQSQKAGPYGEGYDGNAVIGAKGRAGGTPVASLGQQVLGWLGLGSGGGDGAPAAAAAKIANGSYESPLWVSIKNGAAGGAGGGGGGATSLVDPTAGGSGGTINGMLAKSATRHGIDPSLAYGVMMTESHGDPNALNKGSGASGLMQVMPANFGAYGLGSGQQFDPAKNIDAGMDILKEHLDRAGGDIETALATYSGHIKTSADDYITSVRKFQDQYPGGTQTAGVTSGILTDSSSTTYEGAYGMVPGATSQLGASAANPLYTAVVNGSGGGGGGGGGDLLTDIAALRVPGANPHHASYMPNSATDKGALSADQLMASFKASQDFEAAGIGADKIAGLTETGGDVAEATGPFLTELKGSLGSFASSFQKLLSGDFMGAVSDVLGAFPGTLKGLFSGLGDSLSGIFSSLSSAGGGIMDSLGSMLSGAGSGIASAAAGAGDWMSTAATALMAMIHDGGVVGGGSGAMRTVNAAVFQGAQRYHRGGRVRTAGIHGLRPDEAPAILQVGERVLTERHADMIDAMMRRHGESLDTLDQPAGALRLTDSLNRLPANGNEPPNAGAAFASADVLRRIPELPQPRRADSGLAMVGEGRPVRRDIMARPGENQTTKTGRGGPTVIHFNVTSPDVAGFKKSQGQIQAGLYAASARAYQRNR